MLPCQNSCPDYCAGCHRTCGRWQDFQARQKTEREAKKQYLRYYNEQCWQVSWQLLSMQARYHR